MTAIATLTERARTDGMSQEVLSRLLQAVRDLAACRDVEAVVEVVRHAARELVDADGATFVLRDEGQCWYVAEDAIEPLWAGQRFPLDACVSGWAMIHEQQAVIPDIYRDHRVPHDAYRPTFVRSMVMTPVRSGHGVAAIGTYWASARVPAPLELEVLQALADATSVALENARTLAGLEQLVTERTTQLELTNRDLTAFAHVVAHDLKAPLTTILGHAELMSRETGSPAGSTLGNGLAAVHRQAQRMSELIDGVLTYSTAATTEIEMEPIGLDGLVAEVLADLAALVARSGAEVEVAPDLPTVHGSRALLERVLQNLLTNAVAYGDPRGAHVQVAASRSTDWVELSVRDDGTGVPPAERESIFDMFHRGSTGLATPGSGIGLAFARRVAVRHGGTLEVDDAPGGGARFTLRLPASDAAGPA